MSALHPQLKKLNEGENYLTNYIINLIPERLLRKKIVQDVEEMNQLSVESSVYIYYILQTKLHNKDFEFFDCAFNFLDYFQHLDIDSPTKSMIDKEYLELKREFPQKLYDCRFRRDHILYAVEQYEHLLEANVCMQIFIQIHQFLDIMGFSKCDIQLALVYLFGIKKTIVPNPYILEILDRVLNIRQTCLRNLSINWFRCIPILYRLQVWNEQNSMPNFQIFPILSHGRFHIHYNSNALMQLLMSVGLYDYPEYYNPVVVNSLWNKHVEFPEMESHKFVHQLFTNGISASMVFKSVSSKMKVKLITVDDENRELSSEEAWLKLVKYFGNICGNARCLALLKRSASDWKKARVRIADYVDLVKGKLKLIWISRSSYVADAL